MFERKIQTLSVHSIGSVQAKRAMTAAPIIPAAPNWTPLTEAALELEGVGVPLVEAEALGLETVLWVLSYVI